MRIVAMQEQLDENTRLTAISAEQGKANSEALAALTAKVEPITDALASMSAGIRTLGRIGTMGIAVAKFGLFAGGVWAAIKLIFSGASWTEIAETFNRWTGK